MTGTNEMVQIEHPFQAVSIHGVRQDDHAPLGSALEGGRPAGIETGSPTQLERLEVWEDLENSSRLWLMAPRRPWWPTMTWNKKECLMEDDAQAFLVDDDVQEEAARLNRRRSVYSRCGGVSGAAFLLLFILTVSFVALIATSIYAEEMDHALDNWGKPGSGTENLAWYPTDFTRDIVPIPCHSHNDYWRKVPLFSALRAGCVGVEADVWLTDDDLLVGHNRASLQKDRTFRSLYIDPLVTILEKQNPSTDYSGPGNHGVFDTKPGQALILLVDLKTAGEETWTVVLEQLEPLRQRGWLTYVKDDVIHPGPVTVVGSGNTPFDVLTAPAYREAFFDAPLDLLYEPEDRSHAGDVAAAKQRSVASTQNKNAGQGKSGINDDMEFSASNSYYASVSFNKVIGELQGGVFNAKQLELLRGQIRGAHRRGLKVRYWGTPSWPIALRNHVWDVLMREGADMLSADDIEAASTMQW